MVETCTFKTDNRGADFTIKRPSFPSCQSCYGVNKTCSVRQYTSPFSFQVFTHHIALIKGFIRGQFTMSGEGDPPTIQFLPLCVSPTVPPSHSLCYHVWPAGSSDLQPAAQARHWASVDNGSVISPRFHSFLSLVSSPFLYTLLKYLSLKPVYLKHFTEVSDLIVFSFFFF